MKKEIKEHEDINLHIKRLGLLMGLIKLPFTLLGCVLAFPFIFIITFFKWYDGETSELYSDFVSYFYGGYNNGYELNKEVKKRKSKGKLTKG